MLYWIQETKRLNKRVEGHFPGASVDTLTKLKLLGASADHESMTGEEVIQTSAVRVSCSLTLFSIRPDLPNILEQLQTEKIAAYDQMMYTTDGSTPSYNERGLINVCIEIALEKGVALEDAYRMATYNVAKYYHLDELLGSIAPGRLAHINILYEKDDPHPLSVLAKGQWIVRDGVEIQQDTQINWKNMILKKQVSLGIK